jgi:cellulose synthase/poly-beta-1,6-N-acetylglucosamine synthase-like glycosyltransferase
VREDAARNAARQGGSTTTQEDLRAMTDLDSAPAASATAPPGPHEDLVTVVIPARNEEASIGACLDSILAQDHRNLQVIVVDGASTDATPSIVTGYARRDPRVELVENPAGLIPIGLNLALERARAEWWVRVDAHAAVPPDYVRLAVEHLATGRYGGVGGRKDGVGRTPAGRAIAAAMASRFGVGGSRYHFGTEPAEVEHVPFGAYPVAVLRSLGGWDERFRVAQDFEFDYRLRQAGHTILFDPALHIDWECRQSVGALAKQYHRYAGGRVNVLTKHPRSVSLRHLAPPALVLELVAAAGLLVAGRPGRALLVASPYLVALGAATAVTARPLDAEARRYVAPAFAAMHVAYGLGVWRAVGTRLLARARARRA